MQRVGCADAECYRPGNYSCVVLVVFFGCDCSYLHDGSETCI